MKYIFKIIAFKAIFMYHIFLFTKNFLGVLFCTFYYFKERIKLKSTIFVYKIASSSLIYMLSCLIFAKFFVLTAVKHFASKYSLRHKSSPLIAPYDRASNLNSLACPGWRPDEIIFRLNGGSWILSECAIKPMPATCLQFYEVSAKCTTQASYIHVTYHRLIWYSKLFALYNSDH